MFGIIKKYKLWYPWQMLRVIYYNLMVSIQPLFWRFGQ